VKLGIVGSEEAKFTPHTRDRACAIIHALLRNLDVDLVVSGHSPLGGIDIWAIEVAEALGIETLEFPPKTHRWADGYKPRNLQIAEHSDMVVCITVKTLPASYTGMQFHGCYHCQTPPEDHVKSGGCWTMKQAARAGKAARLIVIRED
jgi:hypothetical protein